jgi:hypothetical protein
MDFDFHSCGFKSFNLQRYNKIFGFGLLAFGFLRDIAILSSAVVVQTNKNGKVVENKGA